MDRSDDRQREAVSRSLAHLDLYYHSLRLMGQKLLSVADRATAASSGVLYERCLQLGKECSSTLRLLSVLLDAEDLGLCESTLNRVNLGVDRASRAREHAPYMVNIWRVLEAVAEFQAGIASKYGYETLSERIELERGLVGRDATVGTVGPAWAQAEVAPSGVDAFKPIPLPAFRRPRRRRIQPFLRPGLVAGILIVLAFVVVSLAAPVIAPPEGEDAYTIPEDGYGLQPRPPRPGYPLGTTERSFDVFYGIVWGTHLAFRIGLSVTVGRALIGVIVGLVSGYYGGFPDALMMRITDAFLAFPIVPATLLMLTFFGPTRLGRAGGETGVDSIIILSLILFGWMQYARLVRGNVLAERAKQYVEAAVSIGARAPHVIFRHVLPNVPQGLFVLIASDIGAMVVLAAVFTFLGLAGRRGLADWGWLLYVGRNWIIGTPSNAFQYWYTYLPPIAAIVLFSVGWNLIGDGLRDVLDPRLR